MDKNKTSRRDFLGLGIAAAAAAACGGCSALASKRNDPNDPTVQAESGLLRLSQEDSAKLLASETSLLVKVKGKKTRILVVHRSNGSLTATSAICTHLGCDVDYDKNSTSLLCPCHGSKFGLDGKNIKGPASKPLKSYAVRNEDGIVVIVLKS